MKKGIVLVSLILTVFLVGGCSMIPGLGGKGDLTGKITDSYYEPIEGATVRVEDLTATTQTDGTFSIAQVPAGVKNLTVTAEGYETATVSVTIEKGTANTVNVELEVAETNSAKKMVNNFKNSMYRLGTVYLHEDSMVKQHIQDEVAPFATEIAPYMGEVNLGLMHTEAMYYNMPGKYEYVYNETYGNYEYVQQYQNDVTANPLVWEVVDTVNGINVILSVPNFDTIVVVDGTTTTVDLTGLAWNLDITSSTNPNAIYEGSFTINESDTRTFTMTEEYSDGSIETTNIIIPTGPTAELNAQIDPDSTVADNEITAGGTINIPNETNKTSVVFAGYIESPVCSFNGEYSVTAHSAIDEINLTTPYTVSGNGTFTTGQFELGGSYTVDYVIVEHNDTYYDEYDGTTYTSTWYESAPASAEFNAVYKSDSTTFNGMVIYNIPNIADYQTDPNNTDPEFVVDVDGSLTFVEGDKYTIDSHFATDYANGNIDVTVGLARNDFTLDGTVGINLVDGIANISVVDDANTELALTVYENSTTAPTGTITGADGVEYATFVPEYDTNLGEGMKVQFTDGSYEFLPLNPMAYFVQ